MAWSYLMLLAPLAVLGLPGCFGKFTEHFRQRGQLRTFVTRISSISIVMTILMAGVIIGFPKKFAGILFRDRGQVDLVRSLGLALIAVTGLNFLSTLVPQSTSSMCRSGPLHDQQGLARSRSLPESRDSPPRSGFTTRRIDASSYAIGRRPFEREKVIRGACQTLPHGFRGLSRTRIQ